MSDEAPTQRRPETPMKTLTVEELVAAMEDETPLTEAEIEATFTDIEPSEVTTIYFPSVDASGESDESPG